MSEDRPTRADRMERNESVTAILNQKGKDAITHSSEAIGDRENQTSLPRNGKQPTPVASSPRRGPRLLEISLQAYELHLQHFNQNEIAEHLDVTSRQVRNYIRKARTYLGVPEGMKHAALAEIMLTTRRAWENYYKTEDPRIKVLWFKAALSAQIHRDRLLGLLSSQEVNPDE